MGCDEAEESGGGFEGGQVEAVREIDVANHTLLRGGIPMDGIRINLHDVMGHPKGANDDQ